MWLHLLAYGTLAMTIAYAIQHSRRRTAHLLILVFVATVLYGTGIELVQYTLPARTFSLADILTNAVGATIAVFAWRFVDAYARFYRVRRLSRAELVP